MSRAPGLHSSLTGVGDVKTRYTTWRHCFAAVDDELRKRLRSGMTVCDLGGGANPMLSREERRHLGLAYVVLDIDGDELAKAPPDVEKVQADITTETGLSASF